MGARPLQPGQVGAEHDDVRVRRQAAGEHGVDACHARHGAAQPFEQAARVRRPAPFHAGADASDERIPLVSGDDVFGDGQYPSRPCLA